MLLYVEGESRYELYGREARGASWARMSSEPVNNDNNNKWIIAHYGKRTCSSIERKREREYLFCHLAHCQKVDFIFVFHFSFSFLYSLYFLYDRLAILPWASSRIFSLCLAHEHIFKIFSIYICMYIHLAMYVVCSKERGCLPSCTFVCDCIYLGECTQLFGWLRQKRHLPKYRWTFHILLNCPKYFLPNF